MDCIEFGTGGKYAHVARLHVLPPLRYAVRAINYCSEYNFVPMQGSPHSNRRAEPPNADPKAPDFQVRDRAPQLPGPDLNNLDV